MLKKRLFTLENYEVLCLFCSWLSKPIGGLNLHLISVYNVGATPSAVPLTSQSVGAADWRLVMFLKQSLFPLRFLCWIQLCVTVTVNTHRSPSPSSQLRRDSEGRRERKRERRREIHCLGLHVCVSLYERCCLCIKESLKKMHFVCVCVKE